MFFKKRELCLYCYEFKKRFLNINLKKANYRSIKRTKANNFDIARKTIINFLCF